MSLRRVLAAGFKHHGQDTLSETELVAALALERGWYTPAEVRTLIEHGLEAGDLEGESEALQPTFDVGSVTIPSGYEPPDELVDPPAPFEQLIERLESAGNDKREAVASINQLQADLGITSDAAALLYTHGEGLDTTEEAHRIKESLESV